MAFPVVAAEGGEIAASSAASKGVTKFVPNAATTGAVAGTAASRLQSKDFKGRDKKRVRRIEKDFRKLKSALPTKLPIIKGNQLTKVSPKDAQRTIAVGLLAIFALHLGLSGKLSNLVKLAQ